MDSLAYKAATDSEIGTEDCVIVDSEINIEDCVTAYLEINTEDCVAANLVLNSEIGNENCVAANSESVTRTLSLPIQKSTTMVGLFYFYLFFVWCLH